MNISIKAAKELGEIFAKSLHRHSDPALRGAVISAKEDALDSITKHEARLALRRSYSKALDELEPLPSGTDRTY